MGKNTMMKRCIRLYCERTKDDAWAALLPHLVGNVGVVFSKRDLGEIRDEIEKHKVGAPARVGGIAPNDVTVPAGPTCKSASLKRGRVILLRAVDILHTRHVESRACKHHPAPQEAVVLGRFPC